MNKMYPNKSDVFSKEQHEGESKAPGSLDDDVKLITPTPLGHVDNDKDVDVLYGCSCCRAKVCGVL